MEDRIGDAVKVPLRFVRGEVHWREIEELGVAIEFDEQGLGTLTEEAQNYSTTPEVRDVAWGFMRHFSSETALREWAFVVLGASNLIDLSALEGSESGRKLLDPALLLGGREKGEEHESE